MADGPELSELVRRTIEANTRFYQGWVNLSLEYVRGITEIFGGVQSATSSSPSEPMEPASDAVVLEAVEGETAAGAFLVTNDLGRTLTCELVMSDFQGGDGEEPTAEVHFDPPRFDLAPGEQRVVRATVAIDPDLRAGAAYTGTFAVKGMKGFSVPVVLRKRHAVDLSPIDRLADAPTPTAAAGAKPKKTPAAKTPAAKKASAKKKTAKKAPAKKTSTSKAGKKSRK
jgi:hypothetical protein